MGSDCEICILIAKINKFLFVCLFQGLKQLAVQDHQVLQALQRRQLEKEFIQGILQFQEEGKKVDCGKQSLLMLSEV